MVEGTTLFERMTRVALQAKTEDQLIEMVMAKTDRITALEAENARLRGVVIECGRAVGAHLADDVSTDFLMFVPAEVKAFAESPTP